MHLNNLQEAQRPQLQPHTLMGPRLLFPGQAWRSILSGDPRWGWAGTHLDGLKWAEPDVSKELC